MKASLVLPEHIDTCWERVLPIIAPAVATSHGRYSPHDLYVELCNGQQQLWVCFDDDGIHGAATTRLVNYPQRRVLSGHFCGGTRMHEWKAPLLGLLERFARDHDCDGMEMLGRRGWERVLDSFGWKPSHVTFEKDF